MEDEKSKYIEKQLAEDVVKEYSKIVEAYKEIYRSAMFALDVPADKIEIMLGEVYQP